MNKKRFDPNNTSAIEDELDQSGFFKQPSPLAATRKEVVLKPGIPVSQVSSFPGKQDSGNPSSQEPRKMETQENGKRAGFPKQTFNILPEVIALLNATKETLKWKYNIKATKEQIAEIAIKELCLDVQRNDKESTLVKQLSKNPGTH